MDTTSLINDRDFGNRKFIHVGLNRHASSPSFFSSSSSQKKDSPGMRSGNKQWVHPPDALLRGHILYNVKFLGECSVDLPKGTEVVKEAIRKMKFNKHIKRAEGQKPPKVELTISADGLTIQDPKSKMIMHQYPLHRISYCADDKSDKRMFTFIAKTANSNQHNCYVFDSEKCAEEITLTVGQAFDLAYRRFLETSGKDIDFKKQFLAMQKQVQNLQFENEQLKKRIAELEQLKDRSDLAEFMKSHQSDKQATVGRRLENLILEDFGNGTGQTNGSTAAATVHSPLTSPPSGGQPAPLLSPPPPSTRSRTTVGVPRQLVSPAATTPTTTQTNAAGQVNPFGSQGGGAASSFDDPFGMGAFNPSSNVSTLDADQDIMAIQAGFSRGLSIGTDDFSLDDLDPLNQRL